jgi:GGDEF domain-containing protein
MRTEVERRRVLVAARGCELPSLQALFAAEALAPWEAVEAESLEQARFKLQHTACDILLVDESLACCGSPEGLAWLAERGAPTVFLAGCDAETCTRAYEHGATICLPRGLTLGHPPLLAAALRRACRDGETARAHCRVKDSLHQCRRQVDRLVNLLWRTVPMDTQTHWCTQRHVLERLQEEVARTDRHGGPLTVAVGEVEATPGADEPGEGAAWTERLTRAKRRCDVAGQYGLQGFLLLMVQTPKEGAVTCCRRLQQALEAPAAGGPRGPVRVSFGIASVSGDGATPQALLRQAEQNLEAATAGASDRVVAG